MKKHIAQITYLLIIGLALFFFFRNKDFIIESLSHIKATDLIIILIANFLNLLSNAFAFRCLLQLFNIRVSFKEWFGLATTKTMFNYYIPAKGAHAVRAIYMKKKYRFPYSRYLSLMGGQFLIHYIIYSVFGIFLTLLYMLLTGSCLSVSFYFFLGLFTALTLGTMIMYFLFKRNMFSRFPKVREKFLHIKEGLNMFRGNVRFYILFTLANAMTMLSMSSSLYFCLKALGTHVPFSFLMIFILFREFSFIFSITPGNFGLKEAVIVFSLKYLNVPEKISLLASIIDRAAEMILVFSLGLFFSKSLLKGIEKDASRTKKT